MPAAANPNFCVVPEILEYAKREYCGSPDAGKRLPIISNVHHYPSVTLARIFDILLSSGGQIDI